MTDESWAPIPGYPGYEVSDAGRVRSLQRVIYDRLGRSRRLPGKTLRLLSSTKGYPTADLAGDRRFVHQLVLLAFRGPREKGMVCRHLNDVKTDNRLVNLEYGTQSQNVLEAFQNGRHPPRKTATECRRGHRYTDETVRMSGPNRDWRRCLLCCAVNTATRAERRRQARLAKAMAS